MCTSSPLSKLSEKIDNDLKEDAKKQKQVVSLLLLGASPPLPASVLTSGVAVFPSRYYDPRIHLPLRLGAGESGKSTIFKQMRILNIATFGAEERAEFRIVLRGNVISTLKTLIQANAGKARSFSFFWACSRR